MKRWTGVCALGAMLALDALAGGLRGTVSGENGRLLAGSNLVLEGTGLGAATGLDGEYTLTGVPGGTYSLKASYLGYRDKEIEITLPDRGIVELSLELEAARVAGEELVVVGDQLKGQARSLSVQRHKANISNIVSSDQVGRFPDANVGDALKRIPAITVNYDQGEARFANVRGTEPRLNSVMINGQRIPSAEGEVRAVQLDLVPSDMVQTIEVNKAVTPDMEGDAIGGAINLVTRSAPAGRRITGTLGSGYNFLSEKAMLNGSFVAADRFNDGRLGVVLSGSYFDHHMGSHNSEGAWDTADDGSHFIEEWDVRTYDVQRIRRSIAAAFDYRLAPGHTLFAQTMYNHRDDWENRFRLRYKLDDQPDGSGVVQEAEIRRQTKGGSNDDRIDNRRLEDQRVTTIGLGGDHLFENAWEVDWGISMAEASEERPDERYIEWRLEDIPVTVNTSDLEEPHFTVYNDRSAYELREITEENQFTEERDMNLHADLRLPFESGARPSHLKFGLRYKTKDKERDNDFTEYEFINEPNSLQDVSTEDMSDSDFLAGDYAAGYFATPEYLGGLNLRNSSLFDATDLKEEYAAANYEATETVTAFYGQYEKALNDRLSMIAGLRVEMTDVDYTGNEYFVEADSVAAREGTDSYLNVLPGLHLRMDYDERTVLRFAFTNTLARPNYYDLVPYRAFNEEDLEVEIGNEALEPTTSMNIDLMAVRYYSNVGIVSFGVFSKFIRDFIYVQSTEESFTISGETNDYEVIQPLNGAEATLFGFEFAIQRRLDMLPGLFERLNAYANYTFTTSSVDNPAFDEAGLDPDGLPGAAPHSLNTSLTYQDERLVLGLSYNFNAAYLDPDDVDLTPGLERYYDATHYLDFNGSWAFSPKLRFFLEANNLLDQPLRYYAGDSDRTTQVEHYDRRMSLGMKFDL